MAMPKQQQNSPRNVSSMCSATSSTYVEVEHQQDEDEGAHVEKIANVGLAKAYENAALQFLQSSNRDAIEPREVVVGSADETGTRWDEESPSTKEARALSILGPNATFLVFVVVFLVTLIVLFKTNYATMMQESQTNKSAVFRFDNDSLQDAVRHWVRDKESARKLYGEINDWDTSQVTNMRSLFEGTSNFNDKIGAWDTGSVTDICRIFAFSSFNQDISSWNTSSVKIMATAFWNAKFNQPIGKWDVSKVKGLNNVFDAATLFNQDIGSWKISNVGARHQTFKYASSFNQPLGDWDTKNVGTFYGAFWGASSFNQPLEGWATSGSDSFKLMFADAVSFNQELKGWRTTNVLNMEQMFQGASSFNTNLDSWDLSSLETMEGMFYGARNFSQKLCWATLPQDFKAYWAAGAGGIFRKRH